VSAEPHLKGRNGVAILSRHPITAVRTMSAREFAVDGRYLEGETAGVTVVGLYIQTGEAGTDRQLEKERFMAALADRMSVLSQTGRDAVVCGDWNVAHTENDIKNWRGNVKKSGFLPSERQWLTELLASGWVDVVRVLHPDVPGRIRGGRGGGGRSTTTPAGASTTSWRPAGWRRGPALHGSSGRRRMRSAGPITPR
jgi:exodeoxyribonuclease III